MSAGPNDGIPCGPVRCVNVSSFGCVEDACSCKLSSFYGPACERNVNTDRPDLFYGLIGMQLALFVLLTAFGIFVIVFYFRKYRHVMPSIPGPNYQLIALFLMTIACFLRLLNRCFMIGIGPLVEWGVYTKPGALQGLLRFTYGYFYPLLFAAFTIQMLLWLDSLLKLKSMRGGKSRWVWYAFLASLVLLFIFETVVQFLLIFQQNARITLRVYQSIMGLYVLVVFIVTCVFSFRFFCVMSKSPQFNKQSERAKRSKRNLTRNVLLTSIVLILALLTILIMLAVSVGTNPVNYFVPRFVLIFPDSLGAFAIIWTFFAVMRSRLESSTESAIESEVQSELSKPLMGETVDDGSDVLGDDNDNL